MESNVKKISLNEFRNRRCYAIPYISENMDGEAVHPSTSAETFETIPYDLLVEDDGGYGSVVLEMSDTIPIIGGLSCNEYDEYEVSGATIRHHVMVRLINWIEKFAISSVFYKKCHRKNSRGVVDDVLAEIDKEDFFSDLIIKNFGTSGWSYNISETDIYGIYPNEEIDIQELPDGAIVCVYSDYEFFVKTFMINDRVNDGLIRMNSFIEYVKSIMIPEQDKISIPFIDTNIFITQSIDDMGLFSPTAQYWIPGKRYYDGEKVLFSEYGERYANLYQLRTNEYDEEEIIELPSSLYPYYSNFVGRRSSNSNVFEEDGKLYLRKKFFSGYYDKIRRKTFFDELDEQTGTIIRTDDGYPHWMLLEPDVKEWDGEDDIPPFDPTDPDEPTPEPTPTPPEPQAKDLYVVIDNANKKGSLITIGDVGGQSKKYPADMSEFDETYIDVVASDLDGNKSPEHTPLGISIKLKVPSNSFLKFGDNDTEITVTSYSPGIDTLRKVSISNNQSTTSRSVTITATTNCSSGEYKNVEKKFTVYQYGAVTPDPEPTPTPTPSTPKTLYLTLRNAQWKSGSNVNYYTYGSEGSKYPANLSGFTGKFVEVFGSKTNGSDSALEQNIPTNVTITLTLPSGGFVTFDDDSYVDTFQNKSTRKLQRIKIPENTGENPRSVVLTAVTYCESGEYENLTQTLEIWQDGAQQSGGGDEPPAEYELISVFPSTVVNIYSYFPGRTINPNKQITYTANTTGTRVSAVSTPSSEGTAWVAKTHNTGKNGKVTLSSVSGPYNETSLNSRKMDISLLKPDGTSLRKIATITQYSRSYGIRLRPYELLDTGNYSESFPAISSCTINVSSSAHEFAFSLTVGTNVGDRNSVIYVDNNERIYPAIVVENGSEFGVTVGNPDMSMYVHPDKQSSGTVVNVVGNTYSGNHVRVIIPQNTDTSSRTIRLKLTAGKMTSQVDPNYSPYKLFTFGGDYGYRLFSDENLSVEQQYITIVQEGTNIPTRSIKRSKKSATKGAPGEGEEQQYSGETQAENIDNENVEITTRDFREISGITSSRLLPLKEKIYSDDNIELPFYIDGDFEPCLQYRLGVDEYRWETEGETFGYVNKISVLDDPDGLPLIEIEWNGGISDMCEINPKRKTDVKCKDILDEYTNTSGYIKVEYYIGCTIEDGCLINGIRYTDTYEFNVETDYEYELNGTHDDVRYIEIMTGNVLYSDNDENAPMLAKIEYRSEYGLNDDFVEVGYFKNGDMPGVVDVVKDVEGGEIERGRYSAFEKHNILGEIKTFEDLVEYRNDFFGIKKN